MVANIHKLLPVLDKLSLHLSAGFSALSAFLLFSPETWIKPLNLEVSGRFRTFVGLVFLLSTMLFLAKLTRILAASLSHYFSRKKSKDAALSRTHEALKHLGRDELSVLQEFRLQSAKTIFLPADNPTVAGLLDNGIVEQVGSLGRYTAFGLLISARISEAAFPAIESLLNDILQRGETIRRPSFASRLDSILSLFNGR
jgi:hypothetical protein